MQNIAGEPTHIILFEKHHEERRLSEVFKNLIIYFLVICSAHAVAPIFINQAPYASVLLMCNISGESLTYPSY